jgi:drug/metabolite transporter (DMT)-like permease
MSVVAPIAATAPLFPLLAALALGEAPDAVQALGIALALGGIGLISLEPRGARTPALGRSVAFGVLTAVGFGGFLVAMDAASEGGVLWALLLARLTAVAAYAIVFAAIRPQVGVGREDLPVLIAIGILIIAADSLYAIASTKGLLSVVAVLSSLYPLVTIALARVYLKERLRTQQKLGAAAALLGAVAISAAG